MDRKRFVLTEKLNSQRVKKSSVVGQREDTEVWEHLTLVQIKFSLAQLLAQSWALPVNKLSCWDQTKSVSPGSDLKRGNSLGLQGNFRMLGTSQNQSPLLTGEIHSGLDHPCKGTTRNPSIFWSLCI